MKSRSVFITLGVLVIYRGFASKLHHEIPNWVGPAALFHIRIRLDRTKQQRALTDATLGPLVLESARFYEAKQRWHISLFLLMPDHIHAILAFGRDEMMSGVVGHWKHFHKRKNRILWQEGFFDHRLRDDYRGEQRSAKINYIRQNPVAAGLCVRPEDRPWIIDSSHELMCSATDAS